MPFLETGDFRQHYALTGAADAPVVVLSNSLGTNFSMWDPQLAALERNFRVLRYDTRGHGQSSATPGPYTIEQLSQDAIRLLDALKFERVHFCGLSMGGVTGMWLGAHAGSRLRKLVLCSTAAKIGTPETWNARIEMVHKNGMGPVAAAVSERWFTPEFRARAPEPVAIARRMIEASSPEGYAACCEATRDADLRDAISNIRLVTLVISGAKDPVTPPADGHFLADRVAGAKYVELDASHLSNIEASLEFTTSLTQFLAA